jgi:uncharacterized protein (TIGR02246 family)
VTTAAIEQLVDEAAISKLLVSVGAALDRKNWTGYANNFTEDGVFEIMGQVRKGREEIAAGPGRDLERFDRLQHFSSNHVITLEGDRATASHYLLGIHVPDEAEPHRHADIGGRYLCKCLRTKDGWKLTHLRLEIFWTAGEQFGVEPLT